MLEQTLIPPKHLIPGSVKKDDRRRIVGGGQGITGVPVLATMGKLCTGEGTEGKNQLSGARETSNSHSRVSTGLIPKEPGVLLTGVGKKIELGCCTRKRRTNFQNYSKRSPEKTNSPQKEQNTPPKRKGKVRTHNPPLTAPIHSLLLMVLQQSELLTSRVWTLEHSLHTDHIMAWASTWDGGSSLGTEDQIHLPGLSAVFQKTCYRSSETSRHSTRFLLRDSRDAFKGNMGCGPTRKGKVALYLFHCGPIHNYTGCQPGKKRDPATGPLKITDFDNGRSEPI